MKKMMFLSKNWYFLVQKALIYYTVNKSHQNSFILLVFSHVVNFRYVANFRFLTLKSFANRFLVQSKFSGCSLMFSPFLAHLISLWQNSVVLHSHQLKTKSLKLFTGFIGFSHYYNALLRFHLIILKESQGTILLNFKFP